MDTFKRGAFYPMPFPTAPPSQPVSEYVFTYDCHGCRSITTDTILRPVQDSFENDWLPRTLLEAKVNFTYMDAATFCAQAANLNLKGVSVRFWYPERRNGSK
jgi:hypothetical protein